MIVAGGVYREVCCLPNVEVVFGSGGRAAAALASAGHRVTLHTFSPLSERPTTQAALGSAGVDLSFYDCDAQFAFRYLHPLARPIVHPWPPVAAGSFEVKGDTVLRFGMMEGHAVIEAGTAVFDPQSPKPERFRTNGSSAERLALITNQQELRAAFPGTDESAAAEALANADGAEVVVVKSGAIGAQVYDKGKLLAAVPPYFSSRVYKIGSGDMFSSAFTHAWASQGLPAAEAADFASRSVARYCETMDPRLTEKPKERRDPISYKAGRKVYLAGPFFTVSELWLIEEAARCLTAVGADIFSPYHDVGLGEPIVVAEADLQALEACDAVLAILSSGDPGTLFEVGYAVKCGKPVVAFVENGRPSDETMFVGTGCEIVYDLATAAYHAAWASWR